MLCHLHIPIVLEIMQTTDTPKRQNRSGSGNNAGVDCRNRHLVRSTRDNNMSSVVTSTTSSRYPSPELQKRMQLRSESAAIATDAAYGGCNKKGDGSPLSR